MHSPAPVMRFERESLVQFGVAILDRVGVPDDAARITADLLVRADERAVSTHGLVRLLPYVRRIQAGLVNTNPSLAMESRKPGFAMIDADDGLGQLCASRAAEKAIKLTKEVGFGIVGVHNSHHLGMCAPYAEQIAKAGFIGLSMTNTAPLMAPTGSAERLIGNNPLAIAIPRRAPHPPLVLDIAFSHAAFGAVQKLAATGGQVPEGWMHDKEGLWIRDAATALREGIMAPIGAHKGYGLALIVEVLAAALTNSSVLDEVGSLFREPPIHMRVGHLIIAIDPEALLDMSVFLDRVEHICARVQSAKPAPDGNKVKLPGQPEAEMQAQSESLGIPLSEKILSDLAGLAAELGVAMPKPVGREVIQ
ncbi:hypothetical protein AA309_04445 [Microvirga vignae]|uniref:Lactate dehydrogenase n=2 Tax=Microvirga vignae TaxID=1225564 RepID=A0A0H1RGI4_9HYPH|nr:hypothetical protein AA309_04445 [Microvirga vignae]